MPDYLDDDGRPVRLGPLLSEGGEGKVYDVTGVPGAVAKLYKQRRDDAKLRAMVAMYTPELARVAAWPTTLLRQGGTAVGFLMRKVTGHRPIHALYSPASRRVTFPRADWGDLMVASRNMAAAFAVAHRLGIVVGDVNQSNVLVSESADAVLIDCDSFQVRHGGRLFGCDVGVDLFTPPELQGLSLRGVERTERHDGFGLAVLIFHLLFMGRHPFAGRFGGVGEMPIERAIRESRFAYDPSAPVTSLHPPPKTLPLKALPGELSGLFLRAFGPADGRPLSEEWVRGLDEARKALTRCGADPSHVYGRHLAACPWCELSAQGAPNYFVGAGPQATAAGIAPFDPMAAWLRIERVVWPPRVYQRAALPPVGPPAPWPKGLATAFPPKPTPPVAPVQPPSTVPTPKVAWIAVPRTAWQRTAGWGGLAALVVGLFFWLMHAARTPANRPIFYLAAAIPLLLGAAGSGWLWWTWERKRREDEDRENAEYLTAQAAYLEALRQERLAWEAEAAKQTAAARRAYEREMKKWNTIADPVFAEARARRDRAQATRLKAAAEEAKWQEIDRAGRAKFDEAKRSLSRCLRELEELVRKQATGLRRAEKEAARAEMEQFLQTVLIADHKIDGIGPAREAALASEGIETAADVTYEAVIEVPGFGEVLTGKLLAWRTHMEKQFRPSGTSLAAAAKAAEARFAIERQPLEQYLEDGEALLRKMTQATDAALQKQEEAIARARAEAQQAVEDLRGIPAGL